MTFKKTHLNLVVFALNRLHKVSVWSDGYCDLNKCNNYKIIKQHIEAVEQCELRFFDRYDQPVGVALAVLGLDPDEIIADYTDNDFFKEWWKAYTEHFN